MGDEEIIKALENAKIDVTQLSKHHCYLLRIDVGDLSKRKVSDICRKLKQYFDNQEISMFIIPVRSKQIGIRDVEVFR